MQHWVIWNIPGSVKAAQIETLFDRTGTGSVKYVDRMLGMRKVIVRTEGSTPPVVPPSFAQQYTTRLKAYSLKPAPVRFSTSTVIVHCVHMAQAHTVGSDMTIADALKSLCHIQFPIQNATSVSVKPDATTIQRGGVADEHREHLYQVYVQMDSLKHAKELLSRHEGSQIPRFDAVCHKEKQFFCHVLQLSEKRLRRGRDRSWIVPASLKRGETTFREEIENFTRWYHTRGTPHQHQPPSYSPNECKLNPDAPVYVPSQEIPSSSSTHSTPLWSDAGMMGTPSMYTFPTSSFCSTPSSLSPLGGTFASGCTPRVVDLEMPLGWGCIGDNGLLTNGSESTDSGLGRNAGLLCDPLSNVEEDEEAEQLLDLNLLMQGEADDSFSNDQSGGGENACLSGLCMDPVGQKKEKHENGELEMETKAPLDFPGFPFEGMLTGIRDENTSLQSGIDALLMASACP